MVKVLPLLLAYVIFIVDNLLRELLRIEKIRLHKNSIWHDKTSVMVGVVYPSLVILIPIAILAYTDSGNLPIQLAWFGLAIMISGIVVHIVAHKTLGRSYTGTLRITQNHILTTSGIYKYVRHPGYLGVFLITVGLGLASANLYALSAVLLMFFTAYMYRIKVEEKMLVSTFGNEYRTYAEHTKRILPFVF